MDGRAEKVLGVAVGTLVLLAVVAGLVSANRPRTELPEGSPEAVVQQYVTDVFAGDLDAAASLLDPAGDCTVEDLEMAYVDRDARVVLRSSDVDNGSARATATVRIELVHAGGMPFGGSEWTQDERFRLSDPGDGWVLTGAPWPMYACDRPEGVRRP